MINKILLPSILTMAIFSIGCDNKQTTNSSASEPTIKKVNNSITTSVESIAKKVEQVAQNVQSSTVLVAKDMVQKAKETQKTISQTTATDVKDQVAEVSTSMLKIVKDTMSTPDATVLYKNCAGCHGATAEKKALGKSRVIKGWEAVKLPML